MRELEVFILSVEWRDTDRGIELTLWGSSAEGPVKATVSGQEAVMFVPRGTRSFSARRVERPLKSPSGEPVDALYFKSQRGLLAERDLIRAAGGTTLEGDIKPSARFVMERFINGGAIFHGNFKREHGILRVYEPQVRPADVTPKLRALSLDIETDGWDGPLLSIAFAGCGIERTIAVPTPAHEKAALEEAFALIQQLDPDLLLGWNVTDFDMRALEARSTVNGLGFAVGRAGEKARVLQATSPQSVAIARVPGRLVLDGVATLKNATWQMERYTLDFVAKTLIGRGKKRAEGVDPLAEIRRMHRDDPKALAEYNLEDARLALEIFEKADLIDFLIARAKLTGLALDRQGGSVAAFDHLYLAALHRRGYVAHDVGYDESPVASPGGQVLESAPGLYENVVSFDFRSLYPSIIRTFQVDPMGLWVPGEDPVEGFEGAKFAREGAILPGIISHLHDERTKARTAKNETLSRAIKILMNSFYGVLGTPGCRFFDPRLASSITLRGHEIIERSKTFFEERGHQVIYGDTDSLFVRLDAQPLREKAEALANEINAWWSTEIEKTHRLKSWLELRVDSLYAKFLMPTLRGSDRGSKKRYAGLTEKGELVIRGLEAVRTDWTSLARGAQRELFRRVFAGEPWQQWVLTLRRELEAGKHDAELIYRKRLRREVADYASEAPHVRAAKLAAEAASEGEATATEVEYLMTVNGPEPVNALTSRLDYAHYVDKQLAPALDVALRLLGTSFEREAGEQLSLF